MQKVGRRSGASCFACAVWLASAIASAAAPPARLERFEFTQIQMGVPFKLTFYAEGRDVANQAADAAFAHVTHLNSLMSDYDPSSELSRLGGISVGKPARVSDPLWCVLVEAQRLARDTHGAFDITVGPYVRLWRRARRTRQLPSPERMQQARDAVGHELLILDASSKTVRLARPNMRLDLGGIAAGYAVDEVLKLLRKRGINRALLDASGDIGASEPPPGKGDWRVAVAPLEADGPASCYIDLACAAVTTSGDAFQHVDIGGKRYSHIVDPRTGVALTDSASATVYAPTCIVADSLATAASVLGPEAGVALVDRTPGAASLFVCARGGRVETIRSKRWDAKCRPSAPREKR